MVADHKLEASYSLIVCMQSW